MECMYLILVLIGFSHTDAYNSSIDMCRCVYPFICGNCSTSIICKPGARIKITTVEYRDSSIQRTCGTCAGCCYIKLHISTEHKESINELCNNQDVCNLESWKPNTRWKMRITFMCEYSPPAPRTTTTTGVTTRTTQTTTLHETTTKTSVSSSLPSTEQASSTFSTDSIRTVTMNHDHIKSGSFPFAASIAIPTAVVVIILIISGIVCGIRKRVINNTQRSPEGNSVRMQDVTNHAVEIDTDYVGHYEGLVEQTEQEHVYEQGSSARMQDGINEAVERDVYSVGHYEGLGEQTEHEHVYEKANPRTFTRGSQNTYVNC